MEVCARVEGAGWARAAVLDRRTAVPPGVLLQVEPPPLCGIGDERRAVAREARRGGAVERVDARAHCGDDVVDVADPEQVPGDRLRDRLERPSHDLLPLLLLLPQPA